MALVKCRDCGSEISDRARSCPRCGGPTRDAPRGSTNTSKAVLVLIVFATAAVIVVPVIGILAAIAIPNFVKMQLRAKRAEAPACVDGIRSAEMAYFAVFDRYLPVSEPAPRALDELGESPVAWPEGTVFDELGWAPDALVRGTYWVDVSADGADFEVHGSIDADGDREPAHYISTATQSATMTTDTRTY